MSELIIGIDLGTTNSEVAVIDHGQVRLIPVDGSPILPSVVGLGEDGALLVGQSARNQYVLAPERTIRSVKRRMGEDIKLPMGDREYSPQEISALILARLKRAAEQALDQPIGKAVITVPAYFSDAQRQATRDAGQLAGLEVVRIINEPTAAALAYEVDHREPKTILVYDLGGGTFDVSIVRLSQEVTEVLSSHGNNQLGGDDFDARILDRLLAHLRDQGVDPTANRIAMARLTRAAELAKIALSDAPFTRIEEEYLLDHQGRPLNLALELSRLEYESMIESMIDDTMDAVNTALDGAGLSIRDLDEVLLVGGATRTPMIQERLEALLRIQPRGEIDPDLCVASGAAVQAAVIAGQQVSRVLVDVTPYTFGTSALGELHGAFYPYTFVPLIRKNTPIPVTKSEAFRTVSDGQTIIEVRVFQGEDPDALNNTEIGSFRVEGLRDVPAGNLIVTTFALDINGILHVSAREKETGLERRITIDNATARFAQDEMAAARARIGALIEGETGDLDPPTATEAEHRETVRAEALIEKAERLMGTVTADDREDLVNLIEALRDGLAERDEQMIQHSMDALADLIFYLDT